MRLSTVSIIIGVYYFLTTFRGLLLSRHFLFPPVEPEVFSSYRTKAKASYIMYKAFNWNSYTFSNPNINRHINHCNIMKYCYAIWNNLRLWNILSNDKIWSEIRLSHLRSKYFIASATSYPQDISLAAGEFHWKKHFRRSAFFMAPLNSSHPNESLISQDRQKWLFLPHLYS